MTGFALVAGASGFLGGKITERLLTEGWRVRGHGYSRELPEWASGAEYFSGDLREEAPCAEAVQGVDTVICCSANTQGASVIATTPLAHVTPNVVLNARLMEAAYQAGVKRFVFISSGAAYPDTGHRPAEEHEMFENDPLDVYYAVAWMKRYAEILCRTYATKLKQPMPCTVIRPSNVYGPGDKYDPKKSHVTAALIRRVATRETPMEIWGTGEDVRDLIYIDDFVDGVMACLAAEESHLEINLCSGTGVSVKQILETLIDVDGWSDAAYSFDPSKPSTAKVRRLSAALATEKLGFKTKIDLAEGLSRSLAWYRKTYV